ncbi:hypothetical protein [Ruminiclostridium cellulolyticum]|uniref:Uncharacterized protein n=1 Tax=Ruminiclostridium cellulolyticum (strain ATCC 35319 / DSM 5812 / JCM 6584 / H10) TaxID=394503 RepID=B8I0W9_RUMCH|nr:hypothetical protein [Ruminiclostridium cellulolyticum]ACL77525.1 hypothetical protein Ccel_3235 [Ruminiclostridium cellulolyticum H10]
MKLRKHIVFVFIIVFFISNYNTVNADTGPKPTLEITVVNPQDSSYYLDLLGKDGEYLNATDGNKEYDNMHDQPIYKYNKDGWKAIHMRTWLLNGKLTGDPVEKDTNGKVLTMRHSFGYVGVPEVFKIIIQKSDGTIQVSDIIHNTYFNAYVKYDMKTNKVLSVRGNILQGGIKFGDEFFKYYMIRLLVTLILEVFFAIPFFYLKAKRLLIIVGVNIITQTLLTFGMIFDYPILHKMPFNMGYLTVLAIGEVLVFLAEYLAYIKLFGKADKREIAAYTFVANAASMIAGFVIL